MANRSATASDSAWASDPCPASLTAKDESQVCYVHDHWYRDLDHWRKRHGVGHPRILGFGDEQYPHAERFLREALWAVADAVVLPYREREIPTPLDCVKQEAVDLFCQSARAGTVASAFEPELKALVSNFHRKHVVPFSHNPNEAPPAIDLLIEVVSSAHVSTVG